MQLTFLGTGGYHPNSRRHTASLLIPEAGLCFDAGTSAFRIAPRLERPELDLFLTHAHLDHVCGLTYLLLPLMNETLKACRVHATRTVINAVRTHLFSQPLFPVMPAIDFVELAPTVRCGDLEIRSTPLTHPGGSVGYRVERNGKSFAYVTDTVADARYLSFIKDVDVLIHECYFPDEAAQWAEPTGHSYLSAVLDTAQKANVGRLYLTHIDPTREDDDPVGLAGHSPIPIPTIVAEDLMTIDVL